MSYEPQYALLRDAADKAWEIEKKIGMNMFVYDFRDDFAKGDWVNFDISRDVGARIAHVASWMKDPKEMSKRIQAVEYKRWRQPAKLNSKEIDIPSAQIAVAATLQRNAVPINKVPKPTTTTALQYTTQPTAAKSAAPARSLRQEKPCLQLDSLSQKENDKDHVNRQATSGHSQLRASRILTNPAPIVHDTFATKPGASTLYTENQRPRFEPLSQKANDKGNVIRKAESGHRHTLAARMPGAPARMVLRAIYIYTFNGPW
jgi:hypothetical protein